MTDAAPAPTVQDAVAPDFDAVVATALAEDLGHGGLEADVTTTATVSDDRWTEADVVVKEAGVLCGLDALEATFGRLDPRVTVERRASDGDAVGPGDVVASVHGPARPVLTGERTALNLLRHLSGVATLARRFVDAAPRVHITETRKTLPGLRALQKYAVRAGGATNHRFALWDGVLVKNNHIAAAGGVSEAVRRVKASTTLPIEVECTTADEVEEALDAGADEILLDNRTPAELTTLVERIRGRSPDVVVEASGNVTLETVADVAAAGVDRISVGAITHSAPALDISLTFRRSWTQGGEAR